MNNLAKQTKFSKCLENDTKSETYSQEVREDIPNNFFRDPTEMYCIHSTVV